MENHSMGNLTVPDGYTLVGGHTGNVVLHDIVILHYRQGDGPKLTVVITSTDPDYVAAKELLATLRLPPNPTANTIKD